MSAEAPALQLDSRAMVVAWHDPLGPAVAWFSAWSREQPERACFLGRAGSDLPVVPAIERTRSGLLVAWCERDGAWAARLEPSGASAASLALPGAGAIALAGRRLFGADAEGIRSVELDELGAPAGDPARHVRERRPSPRLSATALRDEVLLTYAYAGDAAWGSVSVRGDEARAVRHRASAPVESLHVGAAGGRAGLALGLAGGDVRFGLLGPAGRVVERPHPIFDRAVGPLASPRVVWVERGFWVLARSPRDDAVEATTAGGEAPGGFSLPRVLGPFAAAYHAEHFYALELEVGGAGGAARMRLWRCDPTGGRPQQRDDTIESEEVGPRRDRLEAKHLLSQLGDRLERGASYRESGARVELEPGEARLRTADDRGRLSLELSRAESAWHLRVACVSDDGRLPEPPASLIRLARWVRQRLSPAARDELARERAWADELARALDATVARAERAGPAFVLELALAALPDPDSLHRWLQQLRS